VTQPTNATTTEDGRFYVWPPTNEKFTSVTTILSVLNKPFLVKWAAKESALCAVNDPIVRQLIEQGRKTDAVDYIKTAHTRIADTASDAGTDAHAWIEARIKGERPPPGGEPPHLKHFDTFCLIHKPEFLLCESTVYNRKEGYAGTMDFMAKFNGGPATIVDVKTGKSVYPEAALQLTAYAHGEFVDDKGEEGYLPQVEAGAVLHIRPNGYKLIPVSVEEEVWRSFLYIKESYRWMKYLSKNAILNGRAT
jgi:hypothetical protein